MENCLVTKLKATVDNSNLKKLGVIALKATRKESLTNDAQQYIKIKCDSPVKIKVSTGGAVALTKAGLAEAAKSVTIPVNTDYVTVWFSNGTYDIEMEDKYNITAFYLDGVIGNSIFSVDDMADFGYCTKMTSLLVLFAQASGTLKNISSVLTNLSFFNQPINCDLSEIADCTALSTLSLEYCSNITGSITDLAKCIALNTIKIQGTKVTGTIEQFVASQIANTRTTCDNIKVDNILRSISFGGQTITDKPRTEYLEWSSANKITMYLGDSSSTTKNNCTLIWEKGATAEEISAWNAAGKTVKDVVSGTVYPPTNQ